MKILARPVEMITITSQAGEPTPVRFRVENKDKTFTVIKVDKVVSRQADKTAGNNMLVLECQSRIKGQDRAFELRYDLKTLKWILWKI